MASPSFFNQVWYLQQNPDVAAAVSAGLIDAETHFNLFGRAEGRVANPLFNPADYLANNPDVAAAVEAGLTTAYDHAELFGFTEGRQLIPFLDTEFYLQNNPDVAQAIASGMVTSATDHFLRFGWQEPRAINPAIDLGKYLEANADVAESVAQGTTSPLQHLIDFGIRQGRLLGNGVDLASFNNDTVFINAILEGNALAVLGRITDVVPFMPTFERPAGWTPAPDLPPPIDFIPPAGVKLVVPAGVQVPSNIELPDTFEKPPAPTDETSEPPPPFSLTLSAGGDNYVNATEALHSTVVEVSVSSSTIATLSVSGEQYNGPPLAVTATRISGTDQFEFDAAVFKDGELTLTATDIYGQQITSTLLLDTLNPAPTYTLVNDTGVDGNDSFTQDGTISVELAPDTESWEYSLNGGVNWETGKGTALELQEGSYGIDQLQIRQTDTAGNVSKASANTAQIIVDTQIDAPTFALSKDSGASSTDNLTNDGTITVTLAPDVATWEYSLNSGTTWTTGAGTTFELQAGNYGIDQIQIRQTDTAGNVSKASANTAQIIIDTQIDAPSFALAEDTGPSSTDNISNDGTITVTLDQDVASWEYSLNNGTTWTTGAGTTFELQAGNYGVDQIQIKQTDKAGNVSEASANTAQIIVDTQIDTPSFALSKDSGASSTDNITNNGTITVTLAQDVASWEYSLNGGITWQTGEGTTLALQEGSYDAGQLQIKQTDKAGNVSEVSKNTAQITVDTQIDAPTFALAEDTGPSSTDNITSNGTVNVTLASDVASWEYSLNGGTTWQTGEGTTLALQEGSYDAGQLQIKQTDKAGNVSEVSKNTAQIIVDTQIDTPSFALSKDSGASSTDNITNNGTITVTLAQDVASWEYSLNGGITWQTGEGTTLALQEGSYDAGQLQIKQTDKAGNVSEVSKNTAQITVDTQIDAPSFALAEDTGPSSTDNITSNGTVNVTLASDVASWEYSLNGGTTWQTGEGTTLALQEGSYDAGQLQIKQTDKAGNVSEVSKNTAQIIVDTQINAPSFALSKDTGPSSTDNITNDGTITVTLAPDVATWEYSLNGGVTWEAGEGTTLELQAGTYGVDQIRIKQTDKAGNVSEVSKNTAQIIIDTQIDAPTFALAEDTGASNTDNLTNDGTITVTLAPDVATWEYSLNGGVTWEAGEGTTLELQAGSYGVDQIQIKQTDKAGNVSEVSKNTAQIIVDTQIDTPTFALSKDTGPSSTDNLTNDGTITVTLAQDVASWEYSLNGGTTWTTGAGTTFELPNGSFADGRIQIKQTDKAGNLSEVSKNTTQIIIDTQIDAPTFALSKDTGPSSTDNISNDGTITVTLAQDVATWEYSLNGGEDWQTGEGTTLALQEGSYDAGQLQIKQTDKAGNVSEVSKNTAQIIVDTQIDAPTFALSKDTGPSSTDNLTNDGTITVTLAQDVASWEYSLNGGTTWQNGKGTALELQEGSYDVGQLQIKQTDKAGNVSEVSKNTAQIIVDTQINTPTFALTKDTGASSTDNITNDGTITFTLDPNVDAWEYSLNNGEDWQTGTGTTLELQAGSYGVDQIQIKQTDKAGNVSEVSKNTAQIIVDTQIDTPTFALSKDTGPSSTDNLTNDGTITVTLAQDVASWEYSLNGGTTWQTGEGTTLALQEGSYGIDQLQIKQTDKAGNVSEVSKNTAQIIVDTQIDAPTFALSKDTGPSSTDNITNDGTITVTLAPDVATWEYSLNSGKAWTTGTGTTFELPNGSFADGRIQIKQTDKAGNVSEASANTAQIIIDTQIDAPSFALAEDTGPSSTDNITSNGTVNVTLASDVASWEYSLNNGEDWQTGTGTSLTLSERTYAAGQIQIRQTDTADNDSGVTSNPTEWVITPALSAPTFTLAQDTGVSDTDNITNDGTINVTLAQNIASWEYSLNGGQNWTTGTGTHFELPSTTFAIGRIQVRQTDTHGQTSEAASNTHAIKIDTIAPVLQSIQLQKINSKDHIILSFNENIALKDNFSSATDMDLRAGSAGMGDTDQLTTDHSTSLTSYIQNISATENATLELRSAITFISGDLIDVALSAGALTDLAGNPIMAIGLPDTPSTLIIP